MEKKGAGRSRRPLENGPVGVLIALLLRADFRLGVPHTTRLLASGLCLCSGDFFRESRPDEGECQRCGKYRNQDFQVVFSLTTKPRLERGLGGLCSQEHPILSRVDSVPLAGNASLIVTGISPTAERSPGATT